MKALLARLIDLIQREPVLFFGSTGLAGAILTLLVTLGVLHLTPLEGGAIAALEDVLVLIVARSQVSPVVAPASLLPAAPKT